MNNID